MSIQQGFIASCLSRAVVEALSKTLGVERKLLEEAFETGRLKVSKPPSKSMGDYSIALHYAFKTAGVKQGDWPALAGRIIEYLNSSSFRDECFISSVEFANGYLNFHIDFTRFSRRVIEAILTGEVEGRVRSVGGGRMVVVEHTSANPVHPLHVGSGRNSVIGDTFARILSKLGFNVNRRYYVNDMGRQVAFLVYGVSILREKGVKPPSDFKPDHWYGIVYALTNLVIEERGLLRKLKSAEAEFWASLSTLLSDQAVRSILPESVVHSLQGVLGKKAFNKDTVKLVREVEDVLKGFEQALSSNESYKSLKAKAESYLKLAGEYAKTQRLIRRLAIQAPEAYTAISSSIVDPEKALAEIRGLMKKCEEEDPAVLALFHEVSKSVIDGFRETLAKLNISFDEFDWESSREILSGAHEAVRELESKPFARREEGALLVDLDAAAEHSAFVRDLFHPDKPGKFIIERSDGTTLYVTRDIAYTIYKFRKTGAEVVYNVIASEQAREQKQVKAVLYLLGYEKEAENLFHFVYELVRLKGLRMSGRRGLYYTLDELVKDYYTVVSKIYYETGRVKGGEALSGEEASRVLEDLAVANARALLLSVEPFKVLTFDPGRLEEALYGSTILYSYVRLQSILRKLKGVEPLENLREIRAGALGLSWDGYEPSEVEEELIDLLADYERVLVSSYRDLKPNRVLEYALALSNTVNKFYESHRVMGEQRSEARAFREALVVAALTVMRELVDVLGFPHVRKI
ncbi:MAG: arginine--tRNA ligase [Thermogladius sp.]|nr:arginine--tRNA ligase [Thermogladius sp.]